LYYEDFDFLIYYFFVELKAGGCRITTSQPFYQVLCWHGTCFRLYIK